MGSPDRLSPLLRYAFKEKTIPEVALGVVALPPTTDTMKGVLNWLKFERLHKYWPVFSRLSYSTILSLSEENIDGIMVDLGATLLTGGPRNRVLRAIKNIRQRVRSLQTINELTPLDNVAGIFHRIAITPLSPTENEPNGENLHAALRTKFNFLVAVRGASLFRDTLFRSAIQKYISRREVPEDVRDHVRDIYWDLIPCSVGSYGNRTDCRTPSLLLKKFRQSLRNCFDAYIAPSPKPFSLLTHSPSAFISHAGLPVQSSASPVFQSEFPNLSPAPSPATSVSSLSDASLMPDKQPCCDVDYAWPKHQHLGLLAKITKLSYGKSRFAVDSNRTWGGVMNQVMINLAL